MLLKYKVLGGHTHAKVYVGYGLNLGLAGELIMRNDEFSRLRNGIYYNNPIEFEFVKDNE